MGTRGPSSHGGCWAGAQAALGHLAAGRKVLDEPRGLPLHGGGGRGVRVDPSGLYPAGVADALQGRRYLVLLPKVLKQT